MGLSACFFASACESGITAHWIGFSSSGLILQAWPALLFEFNMWKFAEKVNLSGDWKSFSGSWKNEKCISVQRPLIQSVVALALAEFRQIQLRQATAKQHPALMLPACELMCAISSQTVVHWSASLFVQQVNLEVRLKLTLSAVNVQVGWSSHDFTHCRYSSNIAFVISLSCFCFCFYFDIPTTALLLQEQVLLCPWCWNSHRGWHDGRLGMPI